MHDFNVDLSISKYGRGLFDVVDVVDTEAPHILHIRISMVLNGLETKTEAPLNEGRGTARQMRRQSDEELARLRKEVKSLREAKEILKKAIAIFAQTNPGDDVSFI
jgi:hypothetical protein